MTAYADFLAAKGQGNGDHGFDPDWTPGFLFPFQASLLEWACRKGRAALFADCGLGKTPMQLVWAENMRRHTDKPVLIVTPLAVSFQTVREAEKFGVEAATSRGGKPDVGITVTNYERLHLFDRHDFGAVVCDESSAIKSFDGVRRQIVTDFMRHIPYRLLCTATAAPNDYTELGTSSEALGYLGHMDMLGRFFTNKERTSKSMGGRWRANGVESWRFKGHAEDAFWKWVASWARAMRKPSDLGFSDDGFDLPPLEHRQHVVTARTPREDTLFDLPALGLREEREESRRTIAERCEMAAELTEAHDISILWCNLNAEGDLLERLIPNAVQVKGTDSPEFKEAAAQWFTGDRCICGHPEFRCICGQASGQRRLITKPVMFGLGMNFQHCAHMVYFPSHSYEQYYQAVRRSWRFGQKRPVVVDLVTTEGGVNALKNLQRKARAADKMFDSLTAHMLQAVAIDRTLTFNERVEVPEWATS